MAPALITPETRSAPAPSQEIARLPHDSPCPAVPVHESFMDRAYVGFGRWSAPYLHAARLSPNAVTTLSLLSALAGAWCMYQHQVWLFALLFNVSYALDCADGQIARRYGLCSRLGDLYDHATDIITSSVFLLVFAVTFRPGPGVWSLCAAMVVLSTVHFLLVESLLGRSAIMARFGGAFLAWLCPSVERRWQAVLWLKACDFGMVHLYATLLVIALEYAG